MSNPERDRSDDKALSDLAASFGISVVDLTACVEGAGWQLLPAARSVLANTALEDAAGGDAAPGFGVDPNDSARLLELRQAIDAIGWNSPADEERGDYLGRLREIREELGAQDTVLGKTIRQARTIRQQRVELRRFNREARARREGNVPLHVTHDRWLQKLHALEQRTALGTATQADCLAIERLKRWLKDYP